MAAMKIFISHAWADKPFVIELQQRLALYDLDAWVDVRELVGGNALEPEIKKAIDESDAFVVVLSPSTINSTWVTREVQYALKRQEREKGYKAIPLMLPGITFNALPHWFPNGPLGISLEIGPGELDEAMPHLLAALELIRPTFIPQAALTPPAPLADLILELSDPAIVREEGKTRTVANATLTYRPANPTERAIKSIRYRLTAPLGPIETSELTWYLENYWRWPTGTYRERAQRIESLLPQWGKLLYEELHKSVAQKAFAAWEAVEKGTVRCFTVRIERELPEGAEESAQATANEAATLLLSLPWELLHDGSRYLFQGARGARVRRQLPNRELLEPFTTNPPVRVLLVSPRPEDEGAGYIDHRVIARPLIEALAPLGDLASVTLLTPPTFPALVEKLERAVTAGTPYHVVHFDGHGVYNPQTGLGTLCFEAPTDPDRAGKRSSELVEADKIAQAIHGYRVPLFFLNACQSAMSDKNPTASVAGQLLEHGVASVVAMSHSVLVETARRFVRAFYEAALRGERVGQAMLAGQRALKDDDWRGQSLFGELHLQDWFVPVLYQEELDPQLVAKVPNEVVQQVLAESRELRLGKLPPVPEQTFVGRSREMLTAERVLARHKYVVIRGEGGEGKTTLAAELARWLVQTGRYARAAFVPFDRLATADAALSFLGNQLVPNFESRAGQGNNRGWQEMERVLSEQRTVIVLDNLESILPPPDGAPASIPFDPELLAEILALCERLRNAGQTRLIFTSREVLPTPFAQETILLGRLSQEEAVELVAKTLGKGERMPGTADEEASEEEVRNLVEAVGGHARTLVLITAEVRRTGVRNAAANLDKLMRDLHARYPDDRKRSLLASVKLSLDRLPSDTRRLIRPLGVFQGGSNPAAIFVVLHVEETQLNIILEHLLGAGLATQTHSGYIRFEPALISVLWSELNEEERNIARLKFLAAMGQLLDVLTTATNADGLISGLGYQELPNILAALKLLAGEEPSWQAWKAPDEIIIDFATRLESLARSYGWLKAAKYAEDIRKQTVIGIEGWGHASFVAEEAAVDSLLDRGSYTEAVKLAKRLKQICVSVPEHAFEEAHEDAASACRILGHTLHRAGRAGEALEALLEARERFEQIASKGKAKTSRTIRGLKADAANCLLDLGRLSEAEQLYTEAIEEAELDDDVLSAARWKGNLASVYMHQGRLQDAMKAHREARDIFARTGELRNEAAACHMIALVYKRAGVLGPMEKRARLFAKAENAFVESLQIEKQIGNSSGEASTLVELANLSMAGNRNDLAIAYCREAISIYSRLNDTANLGRAYGNLSIAYFALGKYDEARLAVLESIKNNRPFGHAVEPWLAFQHLFELELKANDDVAAKAARSQFLSAYMDYRRSGGETQSDAKQIFEMVARVLSGEHDGLRIAPAKNDMNLPVREQALILALQQILDGIRDPAIADAPSLNLYDAAELLLLLEGL